jgi:hypothetical protein
MFNCLYCHNECNLLYKTNCKYKHKLCKACLEKSNTKCILCFPYFCNICNEFYKYKNVKNEQCSLKKNKHYICDYCLNHSLGICMLCYPLETTSEIIYQKNEMINIFINEYIKYCKELNGMFKCSNCSIKKYKYDFTIEYKLINSKMNFTILPIYQFIINNNKLFCLDCNKIYCLFCSDIISYDELIEYNYIHSCKNCINTIMLLKNTTSFSLNYIIKNITSCYFCYEYKNITERKEITLSGICNSCEKINVERGKCNLCDNISSEHKPFCNSCAINYCIISNCTNKIKLDKYCNYHIPLKCNRTHCSNIKLNNYNYCIDHIKKCIMQNCNNIIDYNYTYCYKCNKKNNNNRLYIKCNRCYTNMKCNIRYKGKIQICLQCRNDGKDLVI